MKQTIKSNEFGFLSKLDVHQCYQLKIGELLKLGAFAAPDFNGGVTYSTDGYLGESAFDVRFSVSTRDKENLAIALQYSIRTFDGEIPVSQEIGLLPETPHFGGVRWWFECPTLTDRKKCVRKVGILYLPLGERYFGCRHCHNLTYRRGAKKSLISAKYYRT